MDVEPVTSHPLLAAGRGLWEDRSGLGLVGDIVKRSINHAISLCAVAFVSCLLVLGATGPASADSKAGGGSGKDVASAGAKARPQHRSAADHSRGNAGTSGDATSPQPLSRADHHSGG